MSELPFDESERPLSGQTVVFTGKLWSLGRKEARAVTERCGGACDDDVTLRTTLLVAGAESFPDGVPDLAALVDDTSTQNQKLRRVAQINAEHPGRIETLAWAVERPDGGRGFGFTGGHYHNNWGDDNFRKLILNAIAWTAGAEVPPEGIPSKVDPEELTKNLDPKVRRK